MKKYNPSEWFCNGRGRIIKGLFEKEQGEGSMSPEFGITTLIYGLKLCVLWDLKPQSKA